MTRRRGDGAADGAATPREELKRTVSLRGAPSNEKAPGTSVVEAYHSELVYDAVCTLWGSHPR